MYVSLRGLPRAGSKGRRLRRQVSGTVVLLGLTSLFTDISSEMVVAVLPLFATAQLALTPLGYGIIDGLYQGTSAVVRLVGGFVGDRSRRPKAVAVGGYGVSALCKLALLPVTSVFAFGALIAADRTGKGLRTAPRDALIAAATDPSMLGRAFGVHRALDTLGAMIGPLLAFALLAAVPGGFDQVFVVSFCAALIGLAILVFWVPNLRPATPPAHRPSLRSVVQLAVQPRVRRMLVVAALLAALSVGDGFLYLALQSREQFATAYFPLLFVGTAVTYLLLAVPFGRLADRFGRMRVFLCGHLALAGAYVCAGGAVPGTVSVIASLAMLGIFYAATDGVLAAAAARLAPEHLSGSCLALAQTTVAGGRFVAALLFGAAWTLAGRDVALFAFALLLLPAVGVAAVVLRRNQR